MPRRSARTPTTPFTVETAARYLGVEPAALSAERTAPAGPIAAGSGLDGLLARLLPIEVDGVGRLERVGSGLLVDPVRYGGVEIRVIVALEVHGWPRQTQEVFLPRFPLPGAPEATGDSLEEVVEPYERALQRHAKRVERALRVAVHAAVPPVPAMIWTTPGAR